LTCCCFVSQIAIFNLFPHFFMNGLDNQPSPQLSCSLYLDFGMGARSRTLFGF
jgi:hypothetical protein